MPAEVFGLLDGDIAVHMTDGLTDVKRRARWLDEPFVVVDPAVRPRCQRQGIGGRRHDLSLEHLPHAGAVLSARQDDAGALRLYHGRGWQEIGRDLAFVPGGDPYVILARRLAGHPGTSLE